MTIVIHIRDAPKDWRNNEKYAYVGRPSVFGNLFSHKDATLAKYKTQTREEAVEKYKQYFYEKIKDDDFRDKVMFLKDKTLVCFCHPLACHAHIIAEYLESKNENS